jgi:hypothetical protein
VYNCWTNEINWFLECGLLDDFIDTLVEILTEVPYRYYCVNYSNCTMLEIEPKNY